MTHPDQDVDGETPFPNVLFTDIRPLLTIAQWSVLTTIAFRVLWAGGPTALSFHTITVEANVDRRTVIRAVKALSALGVISVIGTAGRTNVYQLHVRRASDPGSP